MSTTASTPPSSVSMHIKRRFYRGLCAHRCRISASSAKYAILPLAAHDSIERGALLRVPFPHLPSGSMANSQNVKLCGTRVFDVSVTTTNDDSLSPIFSMTNRRGKTGAPEAYFLLSFIDNAGSVRNYAAVVVVRESGRDVGITRTFDVQRCLKDGNSIQLVDLREYFRDLKPTPHLTLRYPGSSICNSNSCMRSNLRSRTRTKNMIASAMRSNICIFDSL